MSNDLVSWLSDRIAGGRWTMRELARRADISHASISQVLSGQQRPTFEFCVGIGRALQVPPEEVLRAAGLLPPLAGEVAEEREIVGILREQRDPKVRRTLLVMLRGLSGRPVMAEPTVTYQVDDPWKRAAIDELGHMTAEQRELAIANLRQFRLLQEQPPMRIIGEEAAHETEESTPQPDD